MERLAVPTLALALILAPSAPALAQEQTDYEEFTQVWGSINTGYSSVFTVLGGGLDPDALAEAKSVTESALLKLDEMTPNACYADMYEVASTAAWLVDRVVVTVLDNDFVSIATLAPAAATLIDMTIAMADATEEACRA